MADTNKVDISDIAFWLFAVCVALLPVGLGGNRPLPFGIAQGMLAFSFALLAIDKNAFSTLKIPTRILWALGLFAIALLWAFVQTQPFVPSSWANPLWLEAEKVLGKPLHASIAINPEIAIAGLMRLITYIGAGILAFIFTQDARRAKQILHLLWYGGVAIAVFGLLQFSVDPHHVLWFEKIDYLEDLTATFISRNHYAIFAAVSLVCGMGITMQSWREHMRDVKPTGRIDAIRHWLTGEGLLNCFLMLLVFLSIIYTHSRTGLILATVGICSTAFFFQIYNKNFKSAVIIAFLSVVALVGIGAIAIQFSERFSDLFLDASSLSRGTVYELTWNAILDNPVFGYGLNNFETVFRLYRDNMVMEFNHAHSDILESLLDFGIVAGGALWLGFALLLSGLLNGILTRRRNGIFSVVAFSASFIVLSHAMIDFSLQIPAVSVLWATLLGTGLAQSWGGTESKSKLR